MMERNFGVVRSGGDAGGAIGSIDLSAKKRRGRPRKYESDGSLRYSAAAAGFSSDALSPPSSVFSGNRGGRGRGRPSGSGNWKLLGSLGELFADTAGGEFTPHVVTVNTGEDVASKILSFSQNGSRGICILSANGTVSNVTIRQPGSSGGILTYEGFFDIVSLSGSFTVADNGGLRSRSGGLSISLAGSDGRVIGGGIAGLLTAASPIQVVVGTFVPNGFKAHHKRRQQRERATPAAHGTPYGAVVTGPMMLQAAPGVDTSVTTAPALPVSPGRGQEGTVDMTSSNQAVNAGYPRCDAAWNGSTVRASDDHGPYPDINVSVPSE